MQSASNAQTAVELSTTTANIPVIGDINSANDSAMVVGDYVAEEAAKQQQTTAMNAELDNMKQSAANVEKQTKLGNKAHYTHLVELMLFWLKAKLIPGYLDSICTSKLSKSFKEKVNHGENFASLLATVWESVGTNNVMTNKYNRNSIAMNIIMNEYKANSAKYATDTVNKLVEFVENAGGIGGLISSRNAKNTAAAANSDSDIDSDAELCKAIAAQNAKEIAILSEAGLKHFQNSNTLPTATFSSNVLLNKDNCSFVLISKTAGGQYAVIDQITDSELINKSLAKQYSGNFASCPKSLRVISETIATQCLPNSLQHTYKQLIEEAAQSKDGVKLNVARRLIYKSAEETFLMSSIRTDSSVVTVAKPKTQVIEQVDYDLQLSNISRRALEKKIISPRMFKSYKLKELGDDEIFPAKGSTFSHELVLESIAAEKNAHPKLISVWMNAEVAHKESFHQVDIADLSNQTPLWERTVSASWIHDFNADFTSNWIKSHGKHIIRPHQTVLELEFKRRLVQVNFFLKYSEYDCDLTVSVPILEGASYGRPLNVLSKEFAVAMHALGDLPLINDVTIQVYEGFLKFSYETDAANYELYVPFVDESAKRCNDGFTKYQLVRNHQSPEDDPSFQTEAEMLE